MTPARFRAFKAMRRCPAAMRQHRGFALVLVLWVLAGLTVVAVAVATSARVGSESTKLLRERVRAEAAFIGTMARVEIIAATSSATGNRFEGARGILFADGRTTDVDAVEQVTIQDTRGLINLNRADPQALARLLQQCGVAVDAATNAVASLADYVDADDLKTLNGAEAFEYRLNGTLPPPRNADLLSRDEVWRVKGWPEIRATWVERHCDDAITVHGDGRFNQSTAPLAVLQAQGIDETIARGLINARLEGVSFDPVRPNDGAPVSFLQLGSGSVGQTLKIRHTLGLIEWQLEYELELTPTRPGGPWRLQEVRYGNRRIAAASKANPVFPAVDHRPSEQELKQGNAPSRLPFGN